MKNDEFQDATLNALIWMFFNQFLSGFLVIMSHVLTSVDRETR